MSDGLPHPPDDSSSPEPVDHPADTTLTSPGSLAAAHLAQPPPYIDGYDIQGEIYRGGQGIIYRGVQRVTSREVAIKMLLAGPFASVTAKRRFMREIEVVARLNHPNLVAIFDAGMVEGCQYCIMDFINGRPLIAHIREKRLTLERVLKLFAEIATAISYAHKQGVVHRDLKPSNIFVDQNGEPKILDFGLAKESGGSEDTLLSQTGQILGTLQYMAPEQALGASDRIDPRTDVYSLGVLLYQALTGRFPYPVTGPLHEITRHVTQTPPLRPSRNWSVHSGVARRADRPGRANRCPIDRHLDAIVLKALAKEPAARYASAADLAADLTRYLNSEPVLAKGEFGWQQARRRLAGLSRSHPLLVHVAVALLSTVAALALGGVALSDRSPAGGAIQRTLVTAVPPSLPPPVLEHVRLITRSNDTATKAAAQRLGLAEDFSRHPRALRRLNGRLLERLAAVQPRVVVCDLSFPGSSEYDADFVRGVEALRDAGVDLCVGVGEWTDPGGDIPPRLLSPSLARSVRAGCTTGRFSAERAWGYHFVARRGGPIATSLPLLAVVSALRPGDAYALRLHEQPSLLVMDFVGLTSGAGPGAAPAPKRAFLPLARFTRVDESSPVAGLSSADTVGWFDFVLPPDAAVASATHEFGDVLGWGDDKLRAAFADRVVIIGNTQPDMRRFATPDGRTAAGSVALAAAVEHALNNVVVVPAWTGWAVAAATVVSAFVGLLLARWGGETRGSRLASVASAAILCGLASFWLAMRFRILFSLAIPALAVLIACELAAIVCPMRRPAR